MWSKPKMHFSRILGTKLGNNKSKHCKTMKEYDRDMFEKTQFSIYLFPPFEQK